jgi:hypothetical protein
VSAEGITKVRRRGSLVLDNNTVYDNTISYAALGVLGVLLARPDDAPKGYRTLLRPAAGVGQASILSAFRELRAAGYRYQFLRSETVGGHNRVLTDTYIYELPVSLAEAKRDHFEATGHVAIDMPDRRKSKGTLASVPDAHAPDAHAPGAHAPAAQNLGSAAGGFSASPKTVEEINQREASETAGTQLPAQPGAAAADDAAPRPQALSPFGLTPEQQSLNRQGAALARAALRGTPVTSSHDHGQVTA